MANRYWVGGSGTWDTSNTANWSTTSGGAGGASVPTTADAVIFNTGSGTGTVNLSGSISCSTFSFTSEKISISAGTSTLTVATAAVTTFVGSGLTFYDVNFTGGALTTIAVTGANTFNNISVTANASGTKNITFAANQTINGTLSVSGTTSTQRIQFGSNTAGTQRTLSVATLGTLTNTNWRDIALTGAASPWTAPFGARDLGNNSGITFNNATAYWVGGTGSWGNGVNWSLSSGGPAENGEPWITNDVVFDSNSGTGTVTLVANGAYCKNVTVTASQALTFSGSISSCAGSASFPLGGSVVVSSLSIVFSSKSAGNTLTTNGKTIGNITFDGVGGGWSLVDNVTCSSVRWTNGTFNTNNFNIATNNAFVYSATGTASISLGSSTLTNGFHSGSVWNFANTSGLTFDAGTSTISLGYGSNISTFTFAGGGLTYYNLLMKSNCMITGANTFNNISTTIPIGLSLETNQTVNGTLTLNGTVGDRCQIVSSSFGVPRTITANAVSLSYVDFCGITGAGAATWSGTRLGDAHFNSGITFAAPRTVYWNYPAGGWWITAVAAWANTPGGTALVDNYPLPQDTGVVVDTGLNSGKSISAGGGQFLSNMDWSGRTIPGSFWPQQTVQFCGNLTFSSATSIRAFGQTNTVVGDINITSNGCSFQPPLSINANSSITLLDNFTISGGGLGNGGTVNLSGGSLTCTSFSMGAGCTVNFNSNVINLTGNNATIFSGNATQFVTGTPVINCTYAGATGTRTIFASTPTEDNTISFNITAGTDIVTTGGNYKNLNISGFSGTFANNAPSIYGDYTLSSTATITAGANTTTFSGTSGTKTIDTKGKTLDFPINFNGAGSVWQFSVGLLQGSTRLTTLTNGTIDLNGITYTCGSFAIAAGVKNLTFNGGTLIIPAVTTTAFNNAQPANFTTTAGTGTGKISMTGATAKTFVGGGSTYNCTLEQAGAGALTITGSNTFNDITNTVQPVSVLFTAATTNTFSNFSLSGTSGNLVTIGSVTAASHKLSKASGVVDVSYCSIKDSNATGGASWQSYTINGNVDAGNNTGWNFTAPSGNGLLFGSNF